MRQLLRAGIAGLIFCGIVLVASDAAALSAGASCDQPRSATRAADGLERLRRARGGPPGWWARASAGHPGDAGRQEDARRGNHSERRGFPWRSVSDRPARPAPLVRQTRPEPPPHHHRGTVVRPDDWSGRARAWYLARPPARLRLHRDRWMRFGYPHQRSPWRRTFTAPAVVHPRTASAVAGPAYGRGFHPPVP